MDADHLLILAFLMPVIFLISVVREKLHWVEPSTRLKIGFASLAGSILLCIATLKFLPRPAEAGLAHQAILTALVSAFAGGIILSAMLLGSGSMQWLKRWNYQRRNGN